MNRSFAIADIHGCNKTFRHLLKKIIRIKRSETVFLLGDYIDRGADSKGVIDTILEFLSDGFDVRALLGNHDGMLLDVLESDDEEDYKHWLDSGGTETLQSYSVQHASEIPKEHIDFIKGLSLCHETDTHVFVHGGLNFKLDDPIRETTKDFMLWNRLNRFQANKIGNRRLVVGHSITGINTIRKSLKNGIIKLDNGCFLADGNSDYGSLVALELSSCELYVLKNLEG